MSTASRPAGTGSGTSARWSVMGVFVLSSVLNYLDRQILAALAPVLRVQFALTHRQYGMVLAAFSVSYAVSAPPAGLLIDRVGLTAGIGAAVALWSAAGAATAWVRGLGGLLVCRALLGVGQAGGVPATGKAIALYLQPQERALGHALSQFGLSVGAVLAPPLAVWLTVRHGWQAVFLATGLAGFLWIPLWLTAARRVSVQQPAQGRGWPLGELLGERQLWAVVAANLLSMTVYTLWSNWTTLYLVEAQGLEFERTALLAALPPMAANLGGLAGGWFSLMCMKRGVRAAAARMRACLVSALALLGTALIPLAPGPAAAAAGISLSFFFSSAWSVNLYTLPLDVYGPGRAAFATSLLTAAYGAMQALVSPLFGALADRWGFAPVCVLVSFGPLLAWLVLRAARLERVR